MYVYIYHWYDDDQVSSKIFCHQENILANLLTEYDSYTLPLYCIECSAAMERHGSTMVASVIHDVMKWKRFPH